MHIGDLIRSERAARDWTQEELGNEAAKYQARPNRIRPRIGKNTVSKAEESPYTARFETIWRLLAALGLSLSDAEQRIDTLTVCDSTSEKGAEAGDASPSPVRETFQADTKRKRMPYPRAKKARS